ncbi:MAG: DEAD/DEAH box helicase family protein [Fusobacteria bacterium]|nr:DEAD/DEAH box helicase family protein [Fusobacteriota bacterium]
MNEADTRAELIDPKLASSGWGKVADSRIMREFPITAGRIRTGKKDKPLKADYILIYKNIKLAAVEAKSDELHVGEGVAQAKDYAQKLQLDYTYATNGKEIYEICMTTGMEKLIDEFPTPVELWNRKFSRQNEWLEKFNGVPFENMGGSKSSRYYQENAVNNVMNAISQGNKRILLTLATGTGKTFIAFQIAWKLFQTRWNLKKDGARRPRILFLADRNILAGQAFNDFSAFSEDALVRISPEEIRKHKKVPKNGSIFFTIFQTFMTEKENTPNYGEYSPDFFDFIIIDECHRGGANNESTWRGILEYFSPAVQLGLTATPKRKDNVDTYQYFGEPVYIYSLKEGINDGFLTPFKVKRIKTTLDDYVYTSDDTVIEGEVEEGRVYKEDDFNRVIEIREREGERVKIFMNDIDQNEKTIVFGAIQEHALAIRDLINQVKKSTHPNYCVRVTANDGALGEQYLADFQDNEKSIPTILTTSQKLSTGVNARNVRNIVLMRPVKSIIEFKQIIGRGTRLFEGKDFFTIYDFVDASLNFFDPEWDGEPIEPEEKEVCGKCGQNPCICEPTPCKKCGQIPCVCEPDGSEVCEACGQNPCVCEKETKRKLKIKLRDGKEREIQHMMATSFWSADGKPISSAEFLEKLYGTLPNFFKDEDELRSIWANPQTRKALLEKLSESGYGKEELETLQKLLEAEKSDLFDVLEYVAYNIQPISREARVLQAKESIYHDLDSKYKEFIDFVLEKYIETGIEELDQGKLVSLLNLKYHSVTDAMSILGSVDTIRDTFISFQKYLYEKKSA